MAWPGRSPWPWWDSAVATFAPLLLVPWLLALLLTPQVQRWAGRHGWVDRPSGHKAHTAPVPLLGGLAVFVAAGLGIALVAAFSPSLRTGWLGSGSLAALGVGIVAMLAVGAYDDRTDLRASHKLLAQIGIAAASWLLGFRCGPLELPFGWEISAAPLPSLLLSVLWIVLVTNAFNLIDGLDGLAAGLGILAALTIFVLANEHGATVPVVAALALAGALAGFLRFNIPPARIFLGDAGSNAIGYTIAVISLASYQKSPTAVVLVVPFILLGVPLLDTLVAVLRRLLGYLDASGRRRLDPLAVGRALVRPDRGHVHHLLLRLGWSARGVLFTLYGLSAALGVVGLWTRTTSPGVRWAVWLSLVAAGILALRWVQSRVERRERALSTQVRSPERPRAAG